MTVDNDLLALIEHFPGAITILDLDGIDAIQRQDRLRDGELARREGTNLDRVQDGLNVSIALWWAGIHVVFSPNTNSQVMRHYEILADRLPKNGTIALAAHCLTGQ